MSNYDNRNRGAIWKNDDKQEDKHPDFKGSLNVDGVEYWVSAWKRKDGANPKSPSLSFTVKPKDEAVRQAHRDIDHAGKSKPRVAAQYDDDMQDAIPF